MDISYQREVVWVEKNQTLFISSLMKDYPTGEILVSKRILGDKNTIIVMDGKQRLTAIRRFMDNCMCLEDKENKIKLYYSKIPCQPEKTKYEYKTLTPQERESFEDKTLIFHEFSGLNELAERDIFQRIQNGIPLTEAEKLNATTSQIVYLAKNLIKDYRDRLGDYLPGDRGKLDMIFIQIIYICYSKPLKGLSSSITLKKFVSGTKIKKNKHNDIIRVMNKHCSLINKLYPSGNAGKAIFIMNTILINEFIDIMSDNDLVENCEKLRNILYNKFQTYAVNTKQIQECIEFIDGLNTDEIEDDFINDLE